MREIIFRSWNYDTNTMINDYLVINRRLSAGCGAEKEYTNIKISSDYIGRINNLELMQFTGLKDKNGNNTCIYEGDIISLQGNLIGNKYETPKLLEDTTNLLIEGFGTKTWRITEEEAMARGCLYSE